MHRAAFSAAIGGLKRLELGEVMRGVRERFRLSFCGHFHRDDLTLVGLRLE